MLQISSDENKRVLDARLLRFRSNPDSERPIPLADELMQAGRYGDARGVLVSSYKGNEADLKLLLMEAQAWLVERDFERAQAALHQAMRSDPSCVEVYLFLGELMLKRGDPGRALSAFSKGLALDANNEKLKALHARAERLFAIVEQERYQQESESTESNASDSESSSSSEAEVVARPPEAIPESQPAQEVEDPEEREIRVEQAANREEPTARATAEPALDEQRETDAIDQNRATALAEQSLAPEAVNAESDSEPEPALEQNIIEEISPRCDAEPPLSETEKTPEIKENQAMAILEQPPAIELIAVASDAEQQEPAPERSRIENALTLEASEWGMLDSELLPEPEFLPEIDQDETHTIAEQPPQREPFAFASDFAELAEPESLAKADRLTLDLEEPGLPKFDVLPEIEEIQTPATPEPAPQRRPFAIAFNTVQIEEPGHAAIDDETALDEGEPLSCDTEVPARFETIRPIAFPEPPSASQPNEGEREGAGAEVPMSQDATALSHMAELKIADVELESIAEPTAIATSESFDMDADANREEGYADEILSDSDERHAIEQEEELEREPQEEQIDQTGVAALDEQIEEPSQSAFAHEPLAETAKTRVVDAVDEQPAMPREIVESLAPFELKRPLHKRRPRRSALVLSMVAVTVVSLASVWGWQYYQSARRSRGLELLADVDNALSVGDSGAVSDAELHLREATGHLNPCPAIDRSVLLISLYRALDSGTSQLRPLRAAMRRARVNSVDKVLIQVASAVVALLSDDTTEARKTLKLAQSRDVSDPLLLDILGRVAQHLGADDANRFFEKAIKREPRTLSASLNLAQLMRDRDQRNRALAHLQKVSNSARGHISARLIELDVLADVQDPAQLLGKLNQLAPSVSRQASRDQLRAALLRARLLQHKGEGEKADQLFQKAFRSANNNALWLDDVARAAFRSQRLTLAKTAAIAAVEKSPENAHYRRLLAEIQFASRDIDGARAALAPLPENEPYHLLTRVHQALRSKEHDEIERSVAALDAYPKTSALNTIEMEALRIRAKAMLAVDQQLYEAAKRLVTRAPRDPRALQALGETALAIGEVKEATRTFKQIVAIAPKNADGHYLLGLSLWKSADSEKAEARFRRAIELSPDHRDAHLSLGRLLLDQGRFSEADMFYQALVGSAQNALLGAVGRAEALIGLRRLKTAEAQLKTLPKTLRNSAAAHAAAARLAIAWGRPFDALTYLAPVVEDSEVTASELTLYGDAARAAGRIGVAARYYKAALRLNRDFPEALFGSAIVALRAGRSDRALAILNRLLKRLNKEIRPPELKAKALAVLGHALVQKVNGGTSQEAYRVLQQATAIESAPIEAYFWLGESVAGIRVTDARRAYKHYLEVAPNGRYAERAKRALAPRLKQ